MSTPAHCCSEGGIQYASIYALRASDGTVLWRQPWQRHLATIYSAPVVANGVIYSGVDAAVEPGGAASALRASDGAVLWQAKLDGNVQYAPVLVNGLFYITTYPGTGSQSSLNALDASNGQVRWRVDAPGAPLVEAAADGLLYVTDAPGTAALDAATGAVRWHRPLGWVGAALGLGDGVLYLNDGSTALEAVDAVTGNLIWRAKPEVAILVFQVDSGGVYFGTGVYNNMCAQPTGPGYVYGLDASTGSLLWRYQTGAQLGR